MKFNLICFGLILQSIYGMPASPEPRKIDLKNGKSVDLLAHGGPFFNYLSVGGRLVEFDAENHLVYARVGKDGLAHRTNLRVGDDSVTDEILERSDVIKGRIPDMKRTLEGTRFHADGHDINANLRKIEKENKDGRSIDVEEIACLENRQLEKNPHCVNFAEAMKTATKEDPVKMVNVVVLLKWKDHKYRPLPARENYEILLNQRTPTDAPYPIQAPTGTVRDGFDEVTYGKLDVESVVLDWYLSDVSESDLAPRFTEESIKLLHTEIKNALKHANKKMDFTKFDLNNDGYIDMLTVIHSGYGAENGGTDQFGTTQPGLQWSHRWELSVLVGEFESKRGIKANMYSLNTGLWGLDGFEIVHRGLILHESFHNLWLPDLYDRDSSSSGLGQYGLMSNSWGWTGTQYFPSTLSAWSKAFLNLVTPTVITSNGDYVAPPVQNNPVVFLIDLETVTKDYLLIENRQQLSLDKEAPYGGLMITHIQDLDFNLNAGYHPWNNDESIQNLKGWPYHVVSTRVVQPDGLFELESYRGGASISDIPGDFLSLTGYSEIDSEDVGGLNSYLYELPFCKKQGANSNLKIKVKEIRDANNAEGGEGTTIIFNVQNGADDECDLEKQFEATPHPTPAQPTPYPTNFDHDLYTHPGCEDMVGWMDYESNPLLLGDKLYDCAWFASESNEFNLPEWYYNSLPPYQRCEKWGWYGQIPAVQACCACGYRTYCNKYDASESACNNAVGCAFNTELNYCAELDCSGLKKNPCNKNPGCYHDGKTCQSQPKCESVNDLYVCNLIDGCTPNYYFGMCTKSCEFYSGKGKEACLGIDHKCNYTKNKCTELSCDDITDAEKCLKTGCTYSNKFKVCYDAPKCHLLNDPTFCNLVGCYFDEDRCIPPCSAHSYNKKECQKRDHCVYDPHSEYCIMDNPYDMA